jgi:hypothetical protein
MDHSPPNDRVHTREVQVFFLKVGINLAPVEIPYLGMVEASMSGSRPRIAIVAALLAKKSLDRISSADISVSDIS